VSTPALPGTRASGLRVSLLSTPSVLALIAAAFLALHVPTLPSTLEDLDSINFALGVRDFDVTQHRPHPPGYPVYILLAKMATALVTAAGASAPEARGLALWGAVFGALAAFPLFAFFHALDGSARRAMAATVVTLMMPLYWFTASRPLSDTTGLAAALSALALLAIAVERQRDRAVPAPRVRRLLIGGAALAGLAIGVRAQTFVLTLPLLALAIVDARLPRERRAPAAALSAFAVGCLIWAVPLVVASGGPGRYLTALGSQGAEDFSGVVMLWTYPSPRVAAWALLHTFVRPWQNVFVAATVLGLAAVGVVLTARRAPRSLLVLACVAAPYAVFHLLFHETATVRYALPLVPVTAYLAVTALDGWMGASGSRRLVLPLGTAALVVVFALIAIPAARRYAAAGAPVFRLFDDMRSRAPGGTAPRILMHRRIFLESRRARQWDARLPGTLLLSPRHYEWLEAVEYWRGGGREPVWFLAQPAGRTDLALFDPASLTRVGRYRWPFDGAALVGGARPDEIDWYEIRSPGWFLGRGWALTPETAGVAAAEGHGPHVRPSLGYVARRRQGTMVMLGGRHLGGPSDPPVRITVRLDDRAVASWEQAPGFFLRMWPLEASAFDGSGDYARLAVSSESVAADGPTIPVGLEQFDLQPDTSIVWGFDDGWQELEYSAATQRLWRWTSDRASLRIHHGGRDVNVRIAGESPLRYFEDAPTVTLKAGDRTIGSFQPRTDFTHDLLVSTADLERANGRLVIETDRSFVPDEVSSNGDRRRLGLRIWEVTVTARN
jgi:hypothetical protein